MRYVLRSMMPKSTSALGNRFVGRLSRPSHQRLSQSASAQQQSITAAKIFQRALGKKSFVPGKITKEVKATSEKPFQASTAEQRSFLKAYHQRGKLKPNQDPGKLRQVVRGAFEVIEEKGFDKQFQSGTLREQAGRLEKKLHAEATPPPPKVDEKVEHLKLLRQVQERIHGPTAVHQPTQTMQEPTRLPTTKIGGDYVVKKDKPGQSAATPTRTGAGAAVFSFGQLSHIPGQDPTSDKPQSVVVGDHATPRAPSLGSRMFTGGYSKLVHNQQQENALPPFHAVPPEPTAMNTSAVQETPLDSNPASTGGAEPPPPPPPAKE